MPTQYPVPETGEQQAATVAAPAPTPVPPVADTAPTADTTDPPGDTDQTGEKSGGNRGEVIVTVLVDIVSPLVGFYGLRLLGFDQWVALVLGGLGPALRAIYMMVRHRKVDTLALFMLSIVGITLVTSYITGSPRLLLAKDGWVSGLIGLWMLSTIWFFKYPFCYSFGLAALKRATASPGKMRDRWGNCRLWDRKWETVPGFHHPFKIITAIWAVGGLLDSATRVIMAYTLPIDLVPALHIGLYVVLYIIMQGLTLLYMSRPRNKELLWGPLPESASGPSPSAAATA